MSLESGAIHHPPHGVHFHERFRPSPISSQLTHCGCCLCAMPACAGAVVICSLRVCSMWRARIATVFAPRVVQGIRDASLHDRGACEHLRAERSLFLCFPHLRVALTSATVRALLRVAPKGWPTLFLIIFAAFTPARAKASFARLLEACLLCCTRRCIHGRPPC